MVDNFGNVPSHPITGVMFLGFIAIVHAAIIAAGIFLIPKTV
jgi:hypothetical protein